MAYKKGESGNLKGRPPKKRTLTDILEKAGNAKYDCKDGPITSKKLLADLLWQAATLGTVTFPDGTVKALDAQDWMGAVKFIYQHIDGPPKAELDVEHSGEIATRVIEGPKDVR